MLTELRHDLSVKMKALLSNELKIST